MAKRVSTDEKLDKIVNFFTKTPEVYNIKDLEKKITKECGISGMILPDLLKRLQDDNLISVEKCGASNVYWRFKYQMHHMYTCETEKAALTAEGFREENDKKRKQAEKLQAMRQEGSESTVLLDEYTRLKSRVDEIEEENKRNAECSVEEYNRLKKEGENMKKRTNQLTDAIFNLQSYVCSKHGISKREFNKNFGVDDDLDYIE